MPRSKYKNLIIVGNGFDCWQDIPTSFSQFRLYYAEHIRCVAEELGCKFYSAKDKEGHEKKITAVEIIYGDPFNPDDLELVFFWNLEARMDWVDDQVINFYFGRTAEGIDELKLAVEEAITLLRRVFCDWGASLKIEIQDSGFCFPDDCFVINVTYTDTVEKRFGVQRENVFHIHGSAHDVNSIVVGHSTHPEKPFEELIERHFIKPMQPTADLPRLDGLYAIEEVLYRTDKHTEDIIDQLCVAFMKHGIHIEDIENIYVLGHSFAKADLDYFAFLHAVTQCGCDYDAIAPAGHLDEKLLMAISCGGDIGEAILMNMIMLNTEYAIHHRNRLIEIMQKIFSRS